MIISGGGTGGHIFPAIAIARFFKERFPDANILFVGAKGKMEMEKVPEAGFEIVGLWISGIQRKLTLSNLIFPVKLITSIWKAKRIIHQFKPDVAVGVGGFASGPLLKAAAGKGIPILLQEQNSYAGLTNKWLAKHARIVCVAHDKMERYFSPDKIVMTGNPIRKDMVDINGKKEKALKHFELDAEKPILFVMGGSLGARNVNVSIFKNLNKLIEADVQLIWQIGKIYFQEYTEALKGYDLKNVRTFEFLKEMDLAYAAADVVIARAGALSISELCIVQKPVIFVPSSNVAEDHQTKNAMSLVEKNAAVLIPDHEAPAKLVDSALALLKDTDRQVELSKNIGTMARPNATEDIVNEIVKLIG